MAHLPFRAVGAFLLTATLGAMAAEYVVAPTGNDANPGSATAPLRTVQAGINKAAPGDTVRVRSGTYREALTFPRSGSAGAPITIVGDGARPVVSGAQVVTGWVRHSGDVWKKTGWTTRSQQVFSNGARLQQIGSVPAHYSGVAADGSWMYRAVGSGVASMTANSFYHDGGSTLYVRLGAGVDPNANLIEAAVKRRVVDALNASWIRFQNLSFRHNNGSLNQQIAAGVDLGSDIVMQSCDVRFMDFSGIALGWERARTQLIDVESSDNGNMGVNADKHSAFVVRGCRFLRNNARAFNPQWAAGGIKCTSDAYGTIEDSEAVDNRGPGFWFDFCDSSNPIVIRNNKAIHNWDKAGGIILEGSRNATVVGNLVSRNDRRGIYISASDDVKVWNNTITGTVDYAGLDIAGMPRGGKTLKNIEVFNNIFADNLAQHDLRVLKENGTDIVNIRVDNNLYQRANGLKLWTGLDGRGGWTGTTYASLGAWQGATAHDDRGIQGDPRFVDAASGNWRLASGSPAINVGRALTVTGVDLFGAARPQGGALDLGACESGATVAAPPPVVTPPVVVTPPPVAIPPTARFSAKVDFKPAAATMPSGWIGDSGAAYAARNGKTYGWNRSLAANTAERNGTAEQMKDTLVFTQKGGNAVWEMAVPNGTYTVRVVCGDSWYTSGTRYHVLIEGATAVDAAQTSAVRWQERTTTVRVSDGRLTLANGSRAWNNAVTGIEIAQQ
jgi:parallel beta-helix repeat protein